MKNTGFVWHSVVGTCAIMSSAQAEYVSPLISEDTTPLFLQETVVTASRYAENIETVPANLSVITAQDIASSTAKDIPSILEQQAGLHVYDITGNRRSYRVDRSGFGEGAALNTLVLVDGRRVNNPDLSGSDWMLISLDRIARIEIIRGSRGSVLYGDNATDSVINIITKAGADRFNAEVKATAGSYSTVGISAAASGMAKELTYAVSASYLDSDDYRDNSKTDPRDIGLTLAHPIADTANLEFSAGYHKDNTRLPGALRQSELDTGIRRTASTHPLDFTDTEDYYAQLNPELFLLQNSSFKVPFSYRNRDQTHFGTFAGGQFEGDTQIDTTTVSPQFVVEEPVGGFENHLTLGFDYYSADEDINNQTLFFGTLDVGQFNLKKKNQGLYLHDEFYPLSQLALSAGYRHDKVKYEFSPTEPGTPDDTDYEENLLTAGINYKFYKESYVYASFSEGFRYPVLDELFSFFTNTINANLHPQTSDDIEIGVRHYLNPNLFVNLNFFRIDTQDEIFFNPETFANENMDDKTRRDGIEIGFGFDSTKLSLNGTYTYRDSEIRSGQFSGNEIPDVPTHQFSLDATWRPLERLSVALNGVYVGERLLESDFANAFPDQDSYTVVNTKLSYRWRQWTVFMDVNNLFDESYAAYGVLSTAPVEPAYYPSPERHFLAGIQFNY
jgi:iron complex outermembrane receptor protein